MELIGNPESHYYAVIFTSTLKNDDDSYAEMAVKMAELAQRQPGYLGYESAREEIGLTISYWRDLESIRKWKENAEHKVARELGRKKWYASFTVRICKVEKEYTFADNDKVK